MRADAPRLLVVGPARLLHVDVQGHGVVSLYSVRVETGLESDCAGEPLPKAMTLIPDETNQLNLDIPTGQAVCMVSVKREGRHLGEVHLHARRLPSAPAQLRGTLQAHGTVEAHGTLQARNDF